MVQFEKINTISACKTVRTLARIADLPCRTYNYSKPCEGACWAIVPVLYVGQDIDFHGSSKTQHCVS